MKKNKKANVIYVFADQLSMIALENQNCQNGLRTPNIDFLAKHGVKFNNSYCSTPQCSPSRSSMFTGLFPHKTGVVGNINTPNSKDLDTNLTIASYLKQNGYKTPYVGKWHLGGRPRGVYYKSWF
ncbi:sulfatase family protein [Natronospora cellulosivora (SeqCode)]